MVDHAELVAVRVTHDGKARILRVGLLFRAHRPKLHQPVNVTRLLTRVKVQVNSGGLVRWGAGQLERNRGPPPIWIDQHRELRIPFLVTPNIAKRGSPKADGTIHLQHVDDNGPETQVSYQLVQLSHTGERTDLNGSHSADEGRVTCWLCLGRSRLRHCIFQALDGLAGDPGYDVEVFVEVQNCEPGEFRGRGDDQVRY
jgi:hypothetical protein